MTVPVMSIPFHQLVQHELTGDISDTVHKSVKDFSHFFFSEGSSTCIMFSTLT